MVYRCACVDKVEGDPFSQKFGGLQLWTLYIQYSNQWLVVDRPIVYFQIDDLLEQSFEKTGLKRFFCKLIRFFISLAS